MTFRNPYDTDFVSLYSGTKVAGKSLTVPDQTMPLRTILERYAHGLPIPSVGNANYFYDAEDSDEELDNMSLPDDPDFIDYNNMKDDYNVLMREMAKPKKKRKLDVKKEDNVSSEVEVEK